MSQDFGSVAGVDGCGSGWIFVLITSGQVGAISYETDFASAVARLKDVEAIGVDVPIGSPASETRQADREARDLLGPRRNSLFMTPRIDVLSATTYLGANERSRVVTGRGLSRQSYGLRAKILEVDPIARADRRVFEVHPEISFQALAGRSLTATKKSWQGVIERRHLLADAGLVLPDDIGIAGQKAAPDDILDAAVATWSAARKAAASAIPIPDPPEKIDGRDVAIWY